MDLLKSGMYWLKTEEAQLASRAAEKEATGKKARLKQGSETPSGKISLEFSEAKEASHHIPRTSSSYYTCGISSCLMSSSIPDYCMSVCMMNSPISSVSCTPRQAPHISSVDSSQSYPASTGITVHISAMASNFDERRINQLTEITIPHNWDCLLYTSPSPRD